MLGIYDYTVILTYMSALSAILGIMVCLNGNGHPYLGIFFLLFCGLCDAFDGKVARTKKNRSDAALRFGIQIDSFSDLLAFGVLPACIGNAMIRVSPTMEEIPRISVMSKPVFYITIIRFAILTFYVLAALIRLSWFNVSEEIRVKEEGGVRKYYEGLPVTSAALIFPSVLLLQYVTVTDITVIYFVVIILTGFAFISKIRIKKPSIKGILILIGIGAAEFLLLALYKWLK